MMNIREAREAKGMSRNEVCEWLDIPYRTLQNWEIGARECPQWAERLIVEKILRGKENGQE